jgi:UDP-N-acetylglucosamine 1-carboxyvinyltransferase
MARVLNKMGARIRGAGTSLINIEGVDELHPLDHAIIPDRVEAGTLMVAAAVTRGNVLVKDCLPEHLDAVIAKLRAAGVEVTVEGDAVRVVGRGEIRPADIATRPYPGFPTDMQAQFMVLMAQARGQSVLSENIFENRFMHVPELRRMGADIVVEGHTAIVRGPTKLKGAKVMATDLRASACLVLAGLIADGTTEVLRVYHLDRGYEHLEKKLRGLGADIRRVKADGDHSGQGHVHGDVYGHVHDHPSSPCWMSMVGLGRRHRRGGRGFAALATWCARARSRVFWWSWLR